MLLTLMPDLNIAALKYAHITREFGGPIASVTFRERKLAEGPHFEAFAFLDDKKTGLALKGDPLIGGAHGVGIAVSKPEAVHGAISNALELWAWSWSLENAELRKALGFGLNASREGFAAFPGLGQQGARKRALFAAAARWAIRAWWEGKLRHSELALPGFHAVQILPPIPGVCVALAWWAQNGYACYGYAGSYNAATAAEQAKNELQKNRDRLELLATSRSMIGPGGSSLAERRMLFFGDAAGASAFRERVARQGSPVAAPALLVDQPVRGDWSQYAHVWRCLFDCHKLCETDKDDYFLL